MTSGNNLEFKPSKPWVFLLRSNVAEISHPEPICGAMKSPSRGGSGPRPRPLTRPTPPGRSSKFPANRRAAATGTRAPPAP